MLKSIPKSNISIKRFPVYKEWQQTQADSPVIEAYNEPAFFDSVTSAKSDGIYISPLYNSTRAKYYTSNGDVFIQHGVVRNPGNFAAERQYAETVYIIRIPQIKIGEQIKKGSVVFTDEDNNNTYMDDGFGGITTEQPVYNFISYDVETQLLVLEDEAGEYNIVLSTLDLQSGVGTFYYNDDSANLVVIQIDFQTGLITMSQPFDFNGSGFEYGRIGNIFYDEGIIVLTAVDNLVNYTLMYRSTVTIHQTEVLVTVDTGEFNYSQNPIAVEVSLFSSSSFTTTAISNQKPAGTVNIKQINDIYRKPYYYGTLGATTGSWNDYFDSGSTDPTGSYLTPFITTIGLYDDNYDIVAVAKLPKPIKNLPDWAINFLIRLDA